MRKILTALALSLFASAASAQVATSTVWPPNSWPTNQGSASVVASYGPELAPAIAAANWTCGAGWDCSVAGVLNKNADGLGTAVPNPALTIVAGTTYRFSMTVATISVSSFAVALGGISTPAISTTGTFVYYITAATTGNLTIAPQATGVRFTITSVSVQALTNGTGDLTVDGNLTVNSPSTFNAQILAADGTQAVSSYSFASDPDTGMRSGGSGLITFTGNGSGTAIQLAPATASLTLFSDTARLLLGGSGDTILARDAANTLALRNGGTAGTPVPQTFNVYNFCDGANCATGYERGVIYWAANQFNIGTQAAGTGASRYLAFVTGGTVHWQITPGGAFEAVGTDARDIGESVVQTRNLYLSRSIQGSKSKTLVDAVATQFVRVSIPQTMGSNYAGGQIIYTVYARDATTGTQVLSGIAQFSCINAAGTETCTIVEGQKTPAMVTAGTLTCTITNPGGLTDEVAFQANCDTSLTSTLLTIEYRLDMPHPNTVTPQ